MRNANRRLPSPAIVISVAALVVAMSGIAWAHGKINTNNIKRHAVATPKLDSRAVKGGKIQSQAVKGGKIRTGAVKTQKIEDGAVTAEKLAPGVLEPIAYATVNADGTVDESSSKGVADANVEVDGGIYGFRGLAFTPALVSVNYLFSSDSVTGDNGAGRGRVFYGDCSFVDGEDQLCVSTDDDNADPASEPTDFQVIFFG